MTPVLAEFTVMKPAQQMRVVIQLVGGTQHLIKVMPVIARRGFLLRPLADNAQLFLAELDDLGQCFFYIHRFPFSVSPAATCLQSSRRQV